MEKYQICPQFESAFKLLGKKWTGLIIKTLCIGEKRFTEISKSLPSLSAKMLAERFKELEDEGIVTRKVYPEMPVRIEYELTIKGKELAEALNGIQKWAEKWCKI